MKIINVILSGVVILGTVMNVQGLPDNSAYAKKAYALLKKEGFTNIKITNQKSGYCTMAGPWDWNAATFSARNGLIKKTGAVCGDKIYLENIG